MAFLELFDISSLWGFCSHWGNHLPAKALWEVESPRQSKHFAVIIAVINWILPMPWSRSSPTSVCDPGSLSRSCTHKGPCSCFYALLCQLGILSSFWTGRRVFSFCSGPHQVCSCSWLLVLYILSHLMLTNYLQGVDSIIPIAQSRTSRISERSHVLWRRRLGNIVKKCWSQSPPSFQFRLVLV